MTSMVERVSRAAFPLSWAAIDHPQYAGEQADRWRAEVLEETKPILAAMREPADSMVVAGDERIIEALQDHTFALREKTPATDCWQTMIDKALEGK